jgi:anthranilate synthase/aminodeoxychorismate synthase-like glutamine amidotransferase
MNYSNHEFADSPLLLLIDNYDSFTYNIVQALVPFNCRLNVVRNDQTTTREIFQAKPDAVILSPGPMTPRESGVCMDFLNRVEDDVPVMGVCLGFQCMLASFGTEIDPLEEIVHGKTSRIVCDPDPVFEGLDSPLTVARYHSLGTLVCPPEMKPLAWTDSGILMAARHRSRPWVGVQFHPESFLTPDGQLIFFNFLRHYARLA